MSTMVPSPTTAPMLMTAPIMMTAPRPISAWARMMAPGSTRAERSFRSSSATAELRRSHSTMHAEIWLRLASRMGRRSRQSPKTIRLSPLPNTAAWPKSTGPVVFTYTFTGVVFSERAM